MSTVASTARSRRRKPKRGTDASSAVGSALAGGSPLVARLFHQLGAAVAVAVALGLVWRRTGSPAAVMLLGLNPLVILSVINGGHNDTLVGLGVLGAVLLAEKQRPMAAGLVLGMTTLIKITAILALPALLAWALYRFGRRASGHLASIAVVGALAVTVAWRRRSDCELGGVVALALTAYLVAGIYVLPWYAIWMLPGAVEVGWWWIGAYIGPVVALVAFVVIALGRTGRADAEPLALSGSSEPLMPVDTRPSAP